MAIRSIPRLEEDKTLYDLFMPRGETANLYIQMATRVYGDGDTFTDTPWPFELGDTVYFTVKDNRGALLMQKVITTFTEDGYANIPILPADTASKKAYTYTYDIRVKKANGAVLTVAYSAVFELEPVQSEIP